MKRLQTYFALLAALLSAFACTAVIGICCLMFDWNAAAFLVALPLVAIIFLVSILIGHFISQPLTDLSLRIRTYLDGGPHAKLPEHTGLFEADALAHDFNELLGTSRAQRTDLAVLERREAELISDVAHELRTPLTAIHGNAELLLDPDLPPEMHDKFATTIVKESERLTRLTRDLLSLQRIEEGTSMTDLHRVNLKNLVQEVADALEPVMQERHAKLSIVGEAPDILGDADRLKQVVSNLIDNASRFIEPEGRITVELCGMRGNSIIAVKDDGSGFGDINPKLLFERFYRADSSRYRGTGGTGLGLSIVKSIVEAHDGTVEAFNLPDRGACFLIAIPSIHDAR